MSTNIFSYGSNSRKSNDMCNSNWTFTDGKVIDESMVSDFVRNLFTSHDDLHYGRKIEGATATETGDATEPGGSERYNVVDSNGVNYEPSVISWIRRGRKTLANNFKDINGNLVFEPSEDFSVNNLINPVDDIKYISGNYIHCPLSFSLSLSPNGKNIIMQKGTDESCSRVNMPTVGTSVDEPLEVEEEQNDCISETCNSAYVQCMERKLNTLCNNEINDQTTCSQECASTYVDYYNKCLVEIGEKWLDHDLYDKCQTTLQNMDICDDGEIVCNPNTELTEIAVIPDDSILCFNSEGTSVANKHRGKENSITGSIASCPDGTQPTLTCTTNNDITNTGTYSADCGETGTPCNNTDEPDKTGYRVQGDDPPWASLRFTATGDLLSELSNYDINCHGDKEGINGQEPTLKCQDGNIVFTGCTKTCNKPETGIDEYNGLPQSALFYSDGEYIPETGVTPTCNSGSGQVQLTCPNSDTTYSVGGCEQTVVRVGATAPPITQTTFDGIIDHIRPVIEGDSVSSQRTGFCTFAIAGLNAVSGLVNRDQGTNMSPEDFIVNHCTSAEDPSDRDMKQLDCFIGGIDEQGTGIGSGLPDPGPISYDPSKCIGSTIESLLNPDDTSNSQGGGGTSNSQGGGGTSNSQGGGGQDTVDTTGITIPDTIQSIYTTMENIDYSNFTLPMHYLSFIQAYNNLPDVLGSSPISSYSISGLPSVYEGNIEQLALESIKNIESNGDFNVDGLDLNIEGITFSDSDVSREDLLRGVKDSFQNFVNSQNTLDSFDTDLLRLGISSDDILTIKHRLIKAYGDHKRQDINTILQSSEEDLPSRCGNTPIAPTNNDGYRVSGTPPTWGDLLFIGEDLQNRLPQGYTIHCDSSNNYQLIGDGDPTLKCDRATNQIVYSGCSQGNISCSQPVENLEDYSIPNSYEWSSVRFNADDGTLVPETLPGDITCTNDNQGPVTVSCDTSDDSNVIKLNGCETETTAVIEETEEGLCYGDDYCNYLGFKGSWAGMFTDYKKTYINEDAPRYYKHKEDSSDDKCSLPKIDDSCGDNDEPEWTDETGEIYTACCESRKIWEDDDCSKIQEQYQASSIFYPTTWYNMATWNLSECNDDGTSDYSTN